MTTKQKVIMNEPVVFVKGGSDLYAKTAHSCCATSPEFVLPEVDLMTP